MAHYDFLLCYLHTQFNFMQDLVHTFRITLLLLRQFSKDSNFSGIGIAASKGYVIWMEVHYKCTTSAIISREPWLWCPLLLYLRSHHECVSAGAGLDVPDADGGVERAGDHVHAVELQRVHPVRVPWEKRIRMSQILVELSMYYVVKNKFAWLRVLAPTPQWDHVTEK